MSHKKCPISKVFLELIHGIPLSFYCIVHKSCLCTKFWTWMSKATRLNFSLNTHFFVTKNPYFLVRHFHCCLTGNAFGTSNNPMCHIFLILSYVYIFLSESYLSLILFCSCISSITVSPVMSSTTSNTSSQTLSVNGWYPTPTTEQNNTSHGQSTFPPCCPPASPLLPATSLTSRSLLVTRHPTLVLAIAAWHLVSHPALINAPPTVQTK